MNGSREQRYRRLAASPDPVLREIGNQLVRGEVQPAELWRVEPYRSALTAGLRRLAHRLRTTGDRPGVSGGG